MVQPAFCPHLSAMARDNPVHERKSYTRAFEIRSRMQPLEDTKEFVDIFHIETHSVVPDVIHNFGFPRLF